MTVDAAAAAAGGVGAIDGVLDDGNDPGYGRCTKALQSVSNHKAEYESAYAIPNLLALEEFESRP